MNVIFCRFDELLSLIWWKLMLNRFFVGINRKIFESINFFVRIYMRDLLKIQFEIFTKKISEKLQENVEKKWIWTLNRFQKRLYKEIFLYQWFSCQVALTLTMKVAVCLVLAYVKGIKNSIGNFKKSNSQVPTRYYLILKRPSNSFRK